MKKLFVALVVSLLPVVVLAAETGDDWRIWSEAKKRERTAKALQHIENKGCYVRRSAAYYVKQMNDFYAERSTRSIQIGHALGLIATAAGEDWNC